MDLHSTYDVREHNCVVPLYIDAPPPQLNLDLYITYDNNIVLFHTPTPTPTPLAEHWFAFHAQQNQRLTSTMYIYI